MPSLQFALEFPGAFAQQTQSQEGISDADTGDWESALSGNGKASAWVREILFWILCAVCSCIILRLFLAYSHVNWNLRSLLWDMINGTAWKPFVYRQLVPQICHLVGLCTSPSLDEAIIEWILRIPVISTMMLEFHAIRPYATESLASFAVMWLCLFAYGPGIRSLWRACFGAGGWLLEFGAVLTGYAVLPLFFRHGYVYDFATLATFSWGLALIASRHHLAYFILFVIAMLNRETSVLLILVFAIRERRNLTRGKQMGLLVAQIGVAVTVRLVLMALFRDNPGGGMEFRPFEILRVGIPLEPAYLCLVGFFAFAVLWPLPSGPSFLWEAGMMLIPLLALFFLIGMPDELRFFYEFQPMAAVMFFAKIVSVAGVPLSPLSDTPEIATATAIPGPQGEGSN